MLKNVIQIKPQSNHHGLFLITLALCMILFLLLLSSWLWPNWRLSLIGAYLISGIIFVTGALKKLQPRYSMIISKDALQYIQLSGCWRLPWGDIAHISVVKTTQGVEQVTLPYIGIKLKDTEHLVNVMSARLANKLLHEQKFLLIWAVNHHMITYEQSLINFTPYKLTDKKEVTGPLAAFLHQTKILEQIFGFQLYIPNTALDREITLFVQLLRDCQNYVSTKLD